MSKKCITLITLTAFIIFTLSCSSSTKYLDLDKLLEWEGESIKDMYVERTTGDSIRFSDASIRENIISGKVVENGDVRIEEMSIPLEEVKRIEFSYRDRFKGAGAGFVLGLAVGGVAGALIVSKKSYESSWFLPSQTAKSMDVACATSRGGLLGLLIGTVIGIEDKYMLITPEDSTIKRIEIKEEDKIEIWEKMDTEGGVITALSDCVGEVIDLQESKDYNLFLNVKGYQSAVLIKLPDGEYVFEITWLDETTGTENIGHIIQTESQINAIRDYIEQFE